MVHSVYYDEDDPQKVYTTKKMRAFVTKKSPLKGLQNGVITTRSNPPETPTANFSYRSHTGHGQYSAPPSVRSTRISRSSHITDPQGYHSTTDARDDHSIIATTTSCRAAVSSREEELEPTESIKVSVSDRIAAYKKNVQSISGRKVSTYSDAVVKSTRGYQSRSSAKATTPQSHNGSFPRKSENSITKASGRSTIHTKSSILELLRDDESSESALVQESKTYWSNIKRQQRAKKSFLDTVHGGWYDDFSSSNESTEQNLWTALKRPKKDFLGAFSWGGWNDYDASIESHSVQLSSEGSWNFPAEELICDFAESGIETIQETYEGIKSLIMANQQVAEVVGRDIVATAKVAAEPEEDDETNNKQLPLISTRSETQETHQCVKTLVVQNQPAGVVGCDIGATDIMASSEPKVDDETTNKTMPLMATRCESGIETTYQESHEYLKSLMMENQPVELVGCDIDMIPKCEEDGTTKKMRPMAARFVDALSSMVPAAFYDEKRKGKIKNKTASSATTLKFNPRRRAKKKKSKTAFAAEQYIAAVAVSNRAITSSERLKSVDKRA
ncbi:MAG: hypothetical protein SGBAC_005199 [Bacillariaceae sp.]